LSQIAFEYSVFWTLPLGLLAAALTWLLYAHPATNASFKGKKKWLLATLRFFTLWIILILLLSPFLKTTEKEVKKPYILLAADASASMSSVIDSGTLMQYQASLEKLKENLEGDFAVDLRLFGKGLAEPNSDSIVKNATNIASVFEKAYNELGTENLSAVVLLSDGLHNDGNDPGTAVENLKVPVYTIGVGDTSQRKDLRISHVFYNRIAYLQDKFTVQVDISAFNSIGETATLKVMDAKGALLHQQGIVINQQDFFTTLSVTLEAKPAGIQKFRFELSVLPNEKNISNNRREIFVEVLDARQKVLLLAHSPHPDIAAWKQILELNQNYEVSVRFAGQFQEPLRNYDLVVFHQLPSARYPIANWLKEMNEKTIPRLFIVGNLTDLKTFNQSQAALQIKQGNVSSNDVQAAFSQRFNAFVLEKETMDAIRDFNPMTAPFGEYIASPDTETLIFQRIGKIDTEYPLWMFHHSPQGKTGVIAAEGIWKWKLFDYLQRENTQYIQELMQKTITYLSTKEDKRRFRAYAVKSIFEENEPLYFNAELYNKSYQLINDPDVSLVISNEAREDFQFVFSKRGKAYVAEPGLFPTGSYSFKASTIFDGETFSASGTFSIESVNREMIELRADHALLQRMSEKFGGAFVGPDSISMLADKIRENNRIKPVIYESFKTDKGINLKWLFFILVLLLGSEWFLRKYFGSY
jgi:hypothetical protein